MSNSLEHYATNIRQISSRLNMSESALSREGTGDRNFSRKIRTREIKSRALRFLEFLYRSKGVRGWELLQPPVTKRGENPDAQWSENRKKTRPSLEIMEAWMKSLHGKFPDDHDLLEYCNVFEHPTRISSKVRAWSVGRLSVLSIEADINTPELMDRFIANSDDELYQQLSNSLAQTKLGETRITSGKVQVLHIPPDRFERYEVDTVMTRCAGNRLLNYAITRNCRWERFQSQGGSETDFPSLFLPKALPNAPADRQTGSR